MQMIRRAWEYLMVGAILLIMLTIWIFTGMIAKWKITVPVMILFPAWLWGLGFSSVPTCALVIFVIYYVCWVVAIAWMVLGLDNISRRALAG